MVILLLSFLLFLNTFIVFSYILISVLVLVIVVNQVITVGSLAVVCASELMTKVLGAESWHEFVNEIFPV